MLDIQIKAEKVPAIKFEENPKFGTVFTPYYLTMNIERGQTTGFNAEIRPFNDDPMSPGTAALHYGQSIFEGMKAFKQADGSAGIFRADLHAARFRRSAKAMIMAEIPEDVFIKALQAYVKFNEDNVPDLPGHSLYLRPLLFAADPVIKVGTSQHYKFQIMSTIAGGYFKAGGPVKGAKVLVGREFVRAFPGGTGEVKTAGNYAASINPHHQAMEKGCEQVLYLDALEHEYIDEMGGMNFFAVRGNTLVTPELNGCILHGITRRSILELAPSLDLQVSEERMSMTDLANQIQTGEVKECFACGTAAVVSPIGEFLFQEKTGGDYIPLKLSGNHEITTRVLNKLSAVHRGQEPAPGDWVFSCN